MRGARSGKEAFGSSLHHNRRDLGERDGEARRGYCEVSRVGLAD